MTRRILVTGSRNFEDPAIVDATLEWAMEWLIVIPPGENYASLDYRDVTLVHGAAEGLDGLAGEAAARLGMVVERHPAKWTDCGPDCPTSAHRRWSGRNGNYCPLAGHRRNAHMVGLGADMCIAFPLKGSRGTWDCARRAHEAGIPTFLHTGEDLFPS